MNIKVKSSLYFASLLIAMITYYNIGQADAHENKQLVQNITEQASTPEVIN